MAVGELIPLEQVISEKLGDADWGVDAKGNKIYLRDVVAERFATAAKVQETLDLVREMVPPKRRPSVDEMMRMRTDGRTTGARMGGLPRQYTPDPLGRPPSAQDMLDMPRDGAHPLYKTIPARRPTSREMMDMPSTPEGGDK